MAVTDADIDDIVRMLIEGLRGAGGLNSELQLFVADLLDSNGSHPLQLKMSRRKHGRPKGDPTDHLAAAAHVRRLLAGGTTRQRAVHEASERFRISERTVETAMRNFKKMTADQAAHDAAHPKAPSEK